MTEPGGTPSPDQAGRQYILETGVMIFFGICFLFPGLCSLYFIVARRRSRRTQ